MKRPGQLAAATVLLAYLLGCGGPTKNIRKYSEDRAIYNPSSISYSNILPPKPQGSTASGARDLISYLEFMDRYQARSENIVDELKQGHFSDVQADVRDLASLLEEDNSPYARAQLEKVKGFSYTVFEITDVMEEKNERHLRLDLKNPLNIIMYPISCAVLFSMDLFFLPIKLLGGKSNDKKFDKKFYFSSGIVDGIFPTEKVEELKKKTFNKVVVTPYTGKREIAERNIPYDRLVNYLRGSK